MKPLFHISPSTALFLDRDGTINRRIVGGYVKHPSEFEFLPGALEAMRIFNEIFPYIFIATNQQGVGKGLMNADDLAAVHAHMQEAVEAAGGRIDRIYYAPQLKTMNSPMRKPDVGMAVLAKQEFPGIELSGSFMVGDSINDMLFGRAVDMRTIFLRTNRHVWPGPLADKRFDTLLAFAEWLSEHAHLSEP